MSKSTQTLKWGGKNLGFENWKVFHPNGRHMFTCGEKKANWYIDRKLAKIIGKQSIKLNFIPKGEGFKDNEDFGRSIRKPICVIDGKKHNLQRHHIVPYCYRNYFPQEYKSKNHHDVVLINSKNHSNYEVLANEFKDEIAEIFGVKTINELNGEYSIKLRAFSKKNNFILNNIHSIFKSYGKISNILKMKKLHIISKELNLPFEFVKNLSYIQLYKLYLILSKEYHDNYEEFKQNNKLKYDHGYQVVQKLNTHEKLKDFVMLWRKHFIEYAKPKHMPDGWSIDFRIKTNI